VLRPIYARAIAIGDCRGHDIVIAADDLQGHFLAYQQGPYGFADMVADLHRELGLPAGAFLIASTHTHNGPDDIGIWGGVPDRYLALVKTRTEEAITAAVARQRPATVRWAAVDAPGYSHSFGGDDRDYPIDTQLRIVEADADGHTVATLLDYSTHATVYGPLNKVSPDWPGAAAVALERHAPGSTALVTVGAVGHSWPADVPKGDPHDDNGPADAYAAALAAESEQALTGHGRTLDGPTTVEAAMSTMTEVNDNPLLAAGIVLPVPGVHIFRAYTPPYGVVDAVITETRVLRVGGLAFVSAPGEEYPSVERSAARAIGAALVVPVSLANDQLGYIEEPGDAPNALVCSPTDEGLLSISPTFGPDLVAAQVANARRVGFSVTSPGPIGGSSPPSANCEVHSLPVTGPH
jgi:hypothetical protein